MLHRLTIVVLSLLILTAAPATAQKAFKTVNTALKDKKYADAVKAIQNLRKDSVLKHSPKLETFTIEANKGLNDAENTKLYLKKSYDTLAFFSTTLEIVKACIRLDSIEHAENENAKKSKNHRYAIENLQQYFPNLHAGARFLFKRKKYAEALPYLTLCIETPGSALGEEAHLSGEKSAKNAVLHVNSAYNAKQYAAARRFEALALTDTAARPFTLEWLALAAEAQADTATYHKRLLEGWNAYPTRLGFFVRLADLYAKREDYPAMLRIAQKQLTADSLCLAAMLARCNATFHLQQYKECIDAATRLAKADSANTDTHYYIGASYAALADKVTLPDNINSAAYRKALQSRKAYAKAAEPELEAYRAAAPDEQKRWAPLLYQVYLTLNRGKKFAEIDTIIQNLQQSK